MFLNAVVMPAMLSNGTPWHWRKSHVKAPQKGVWKKTSGYVTSNCLLGSKQWLGLV